MDGTYLYIRDSFDGHKLTSGGRRWSRIDKHLELFFFRRKGSELGKDLDRDLNASTEASDLGDCLECIYIIKKPLSSIRIYLSGGFSAFFKR
jgi:hypothetical protein